MNHARWRPVALAADVPGADERADWRGNRVNPELFRPFRVPRGEAFMKVFRQIGKAPKVFRSKTDERKQLRNAFLPPPSISHPIDEQRLSHDVEQGHPSLDSDLRAIHFCCCEYTVIQTIRALSVR